MGGFLGIRSRECVCKVSVLSTVCNIGSSIDVKVDCDNSQCDKAVTNFNIAIERTHFLKTDDGYNKDFNYRVVQKEYGGMPKNESKSFTF